MQVNQLASGGPVTPQQLPTSETVMGKEDFLKMLITQLRYQDPLNPMEGTEFSAQLAQFSTVEQLANIKDMLQASIDGNYLLATSINNTLAATVIGREVKAYGDQIYLPEDGSAVLNFKLDGQARQVTIEILDENGNVVKTIRQENLSSGEHEIEWDGTDDEGNRLEEGRYTFRVSATGENDVEVGVTLFSRGVITGVRYGSNGAVLMLGQIEIPLSEVYEILMG
ncbi:MAG: flagellar hook capping protein [Calditrichaeota bacterium]|nr:flagellar hook capping protein [Calditrichota bacterium]